MMATPFSAGIRAVCFDAVGTLLHPHPPAPEVYAAVGRRFGSRLDTATIRDRFIEAFRREEAIDRAAGWKTNEAREVERWRRIVAAVLNDATDPDACFGELFEHFARPDAWRLDPDAAGVLAELARRGYRLALASNYDRRLHRVVAGLPELGPVGPVVISSEVGWRKPAAEFFSALCQALGCSRNQVLHVGDDLVNDYEGARAAGLYAILFDPQGRASADTARRIARLADLVESPCSAMA